jgi:hypothetical protein
MFFNRINILILANSIYTKKGARKGSPKNKFLENSSEFA